MDIKQAVETITSGEEFLKGKAKKLLLKERLSLTELSNRLNVAPKLAASIVQELKDEGMNLVCEDDADEVRYEVDREAETGKRLEVDSKDFTVGKSVKFGVLGDTHLCSKQSRLDALRCIYSIYKKEGISQVLHTGNIVDGECRFNRHDLVVRAGVDSQIEYLANEYPHIPGIKTRFVVGDDHEGWWAQREGIDVGSYMEAQLREKGRDDLENAGYMECDVLLKAAQGNAVLRFLHSGGGSAYAVSYTTQKIAESLQGGEKPHAMFVGHHHKFEQGYWREIHTVQTGCFQDQTVFMRKRKIMAMVGGTIVEFHQSPTGEINRFRVEWIPFYDRGFYFGKDKYTRW